MDNFTALQMLLEFTSYCLSLLVMFTTVEFNWGRPYVDISALNIIFLTGQEGTDIKENDLELFTIFRTFPLLWFAYF